MTRARDNAISDQASAKKQAKDQTGRLLEVEGQLQIANKHIVDLKKKLAEAEGAKGVAEYARDEAVKAKVEVEFARTKAESSKEQAEEEAFAEGMAKTKAILKTQANAAKDPTSTDKPAKETKHQGALEKEETSNQEAPQDVVKPPAGSQATLVIPQVPPTEKKSSEVAPPSQDPKASNETPRQTPKDKLSIKLKK
nr:brain acid soluble protein 1-like [Quercus suber]